MHLSAQWRDEAYETLEFWKDLRLTRVVLAREVSMEELAEIRKHTDVELKLLFMELCAFLTQDVVPCQIT